jgi:hypothetical protein
MFFLGSMKNIVSSKKDIILLSDEAYFSWINYQNKFIKFQCQKRGFFGDSSFIKRREFSLDNLFQKNLIRDNEIIEIIKKEEGCLPALIISELEKYASLTTSLENMLLKWTSVFTILNCVPSQHLEDDIMLRHQQPDHRPEERSEIKNKEPLISNSEKLLLYKLKLEAKLLSKELINHSDVTYSVFCTKVRLIFKEINRLNNNNCCIIKKLDKFHVQLINDDLLSYEGLLIINSIAKVIGAVEIYLKPCQLLLIPRSDREHLDQRFKMHQYFYELKLTYNEILRFMEKYPEEDRFPRIIMETSYEFIQCFNELFDVK